MTYKQAEKYLNKRGKIAVPSLVEAVIMISDDFNSRTCRNCNYDNCNYRKCTASIGRPMYKDYDVNDRETYLKVDKGFSCNKWSPKEDK